MFCSFMVTSSLFDIGPEPVHFLVAPGFSMLGLFSAAEPLRVANQFQKDLFSIHFISEDGLSVRASNGMDFQVECSVHDIAQPSVFFVCTGFDPDCICVSKLLARLRTMALASTILGGIDTGSVVLARAGLLKNYRATVHWEHSAAFKEDFLDVQVTGSLFEIDHNRFTSSGGTSSIDLMLQLISLKYGNKLAVGVSEQLNHERIREPHDDQRMPFGLRLQVHHPKLIKIVELMENNLNEPLVVEQLAEKVSMSSRQLTRVFRQNLHVSPGRFYLKLRLEKARQLLRQTSMSVLDIALNCGFLSNASLTKSYKSFFGHTPSQEREAAFWYAEGGDR